MTPHSPPANNLSLGTPRLRTHERGAYTLRPAHPTINLSLGTPRLRTHERGTDTVRPGDRGRRRGTQRGDQGSRADAPSSLRTGATGLVKEPWQSTRDGAASTCPGGPRVARDPQSVGPRPPAQASAPRVSRSRQAQASTPRVSRSRQAQASAPRVSRSRPPQASAPRVLQPRPPQAPAPRVLQPRPPQAPEPA